MAPRPYSYFHSCWLPFLMKPVVRVKTLLLPSLEGDPFPSCGGVMGCNYDDTYLLILFIIMMMMINNYCCRFAHLSVSWISQKLSTWRETATTWCSGWPLDSDIVRIFIEENCLRLPSVRVINYDKTNVVLLLDFKSSRKVFQNKSTEIIWLCSLKINMALYGFIVLISIWFEVLSVESRLQLEAYSTTLIRMPFLLSSNIRN